MRYTKSYIKDPRPLGVPEIFSVAHARILTLGLQIAQSRSYLCTLGPEVGAIYVLGP